MSSARNSDTPAPHGTVSTEGSSRKGPLPGMVTSRSVWIGRILFISFLCIVAVCLGVMTHNVLSAEEQEQAETHYNAIADRALSSAREITLKKMLGTRSMASIAANINPDPADWPFVTIPGYEDMSTHLIKTSAGREMGFCPLVTPDQLPDFENFAYDYFQVKRIPPFPEGAATSSFGQGVWGVNPSLNTSDNRYHESDGSTNYNSPYKIFTPILHHNEGPHKALMINLHFQETRGWLIDNLMDCAEQRAASANLSTECGGMTDIVILTSQEVEPGPGALLMQPIFPAYNVSVLTGLIASSIVWDEVLVDVFTEEQSGVDCVLESDTQVYTYSIINGVAFLKGEGDLHDRDYNDFARSISLTDGIFSNYSASYTLTVYPTEQEFDNYATTNPVLATIGAVLIIVFTSLLFFLYDYFVRREFDAKKELLEAKRQFVRFISHEVRTPLSSVSMGLTLLAEELSKYGKGSSEMAGLVSPFLLLTEEVQENAQSAVNVLNDLLNYDKVEHGTLNLEYGIIPIWNLIQRTFAEFGLPAKKKNIETEISFASNGSKTDSASELPQTIQELKAVGDSVRLAQVIRNLLSNALKFTPEGGTLTVTASCHEVEGIAKKDEFILHNREFLVLPKSGFLKLSVTDTGAGMTEDQLLVLFRDGVQFNVNKLQGGNGTGLGLFITKGIVEQHGGSMVVSSEGLDCGTTFTVTLPLYRTAETKDVDESISVDVPSPIEPKSLRILVVDDAITNRKLLARLLQNHGHVCEQASDGREAVDLVVKALDENNPYDSILMDYEMPVMNGPEAAKEIRRLGCDSFIVGITGNVLPEDMQFFKSCGAMCVLAKPFQMEDLEALWSEYGITSRRRNSN